MRLVTDDPKLRRLADVIFERVGQIRATSDLDDLKAREADADAAVSDFITAGARVLDGRDRR